MLKGLLFCLMLASCTLRAQDSIQVSYSEEADTLIKQRFIDRYENVFMTKVPTRHMFKIGLSQYYQAIAFSLRDDRIINNTSLQLGYEFKFLPAFSVAFAGHIPFFDLNTPISASWQNTVIDGQVRWFVGMRKRIRKGLSANNFSGNYIGLFVSVPGTADHFEPRTGLRLGLQRRFLNRGFMDFAFSIRNNGDKVECSTQAILGIAFGDWKKIDRVPLCDILFCDTQVRHQWKVRLPEVTVGYYLNRIKAGVAFEQKTRLLASYAEFPIGCRYEQRI
ncbi:hypothetical protein GCM10010967_28810 [Dyadobacter beijingensis]|uniref:Exopolysaccharide biosynthesis protein YbjH n=1 Tax=Dyadobacter beijingensis TaxID=365489 RepID=A0ABQ2HZ04_9BACT|nr:hypothetical protein [Dyadobacter beijingensis]GGM93926.1 hypothetical protein GCM10010967_28810 [Dyadobacter beijingensis]